MDFLLVIDLTSRFLGVLELAGRLKQDSSRDAALQYIKLLEGRDVLRAPIADEVKIAAIKSLESIMDATEHLRREVSDTSVLKYLLALKKCLSKELGNIYAYDTSNPHGQMRMYVSIQRVRVQVARSLAILCQAYAIEPQSTELRSLIQDLATVRPPTA